MFPMKDAIPGDVLVLTKPLGLGVAVKANEWFSNDKEKRTLIRKVVRGKAVYKFNHAVKFADKVIKKSNASALQLLSNYKVHAFTEISTGGILGHAEELVKIQNESVDILIHNMPVIIYMHEIGQAFGQFYPEVQVDKGRAPETSGGLLVALSRKEAVLFCREILVKTNFPAWIVGTISYGTRTAKLVDNYPCMLEVDISDPNEEETDP